MGFLSNISKSIDEYLFLQIEHYKKSTFYQRYVDLTLKLSEESQKTLNILVSSFVVILPFFLVIFFYISNLFLKKDIENFNEILTIVSSISTNKSDIKFITNGLVISNSIEDQNSFESFISGIASKKNISPQKIKFENYESFDETGFLKTYADLNFNDFSNTDLSNFLQALLVTNKVIIESVEFKKDDMKRLLSNKFKIMTYSKSELK